MSVAINPSKPLKHRAGSFDPNILKTPKSVYIFKILKILKIFTIKFKIYDNVVYVQCSSIACSQSFLFDRVSCSRRFQCILQYFVDFVYFKVHVRVYVQYSNTRMYSITVNRFYVKKV